MHLEKRVLTEPSARVLNVFSFAHSQIYQYLTWH